MAGIRGSILFRPAAQEEGGAGQPIRVRFGGVPHIGGGAPHEASVGWGRFRFGFVRFLRFSRLFGEVKRGPRGW